MEMFSLSIPELSIAAGLVILLAIMSMLMNIGIQYQVLIAAVRTVVQLVLIGLVLEVLFNEVNLWLMSGLSLLMLLVAGREVMLRQQYRLGGLWGFGIGTASMFLSSFVITVFALQVIIHVDPWYKPQYAIPLLGMMLGNTMTGIAIGLDRLTMSTRDQAREIEARLMLGHHWQQAIGKVRRDSIRSGMIPMINAMAAAGIVSLPGMMTGQILAGSPPLEAVKYQILIMFLITAGTGLGTLMAVWLASKRLFDGRERLRLDRINQG